MCLRECGEKLICNPFLLHKREEGASTRSMSITLRSVLSDAPNTIVQVTGSPLTDKIPRFLGFKERLICINIGDVQ